MAYVAYSPKSRHLGPFSGRFTLRPTSALRVEAPRFAFTGH